MMAPPPSQSRRRRQWLLPALFTTGTLAWATATATATATAAPPFAPEPFACDVPRETRAMISLRALELLRREGFEHVETGFFASHVRA